MPVPLTSDARRELLLDVTRELLAEGGPRAVTMGTVADRAEVTRALVYKHFDNKHDLLAAAYQREAKQLDRAIRVQVTEAPDGFEPKLRAFTRAVLGAVGEHGRFFASLRAFGATDATRRDQRSWDRRTVAYFSDLAATEFALDARTARTVMSILLSGVDALVGQVRAKSTAEELRFLEDTYVHATLGALSRVASAAGYREVNTRNSLSSGSAMTTHAASP
jgi:AcrR family transcriptional regulator